MLCKPFSEEILNNLCRWLAANVVGLENPDVWLPLYSIRILAAIRKFEETGDIEEFKNELWRGQI